TKVMDINNSTGYYAAMLAEHLFVNETQLRNSRHRSVSGLAENCTLAGISSPSTATRSAGLAAERGRGLQFGFLKNRFYPLIPQ
ncbi:MAG: hypothetical protein K2P20_08045, partial [Oscillospiraceae bacterium]|nr:hypothetical protein [Oscillospiraceae bacterium]